MDLLKKMESDMQRLWMTANAISDKNHKVGVLKSYWSLYRAYKKHKEYVAAMSGGNHVQG